jgi:hypothetical protein
MKVTEILSAAKSAEPRLLEGLSETYESQVATLVLRQIGRQIATTTDGKVVVGGLGTFVIKVVDVEKDGKKSKRKNIFFFAATVPAKGAKGAART